MNRLILAIIIAGVTSSCTLLPEYEVRRTSYCKQKSYSYVCTGYDDDGHTYYPSSGCSPYDRVNNNCRD